jgi:hypothetical protein
VIKCFIKSGSNLGEALIYKWLEKTRTKNF